MTQQNKSRVKKTIWGLLGAVGASLAGFVLTNAHAVFNAMQSDIGALQLEVKLLQQQNEQEKQDDLAQWAAMSEYDNMARETNAKMEVHQQMLKRVLDESVNKSIVVTLRQESVPPVLEFPSANPPAPAPVVPIPLIEPEPPALQDMQKMLDEAARPPNAEDYRQQSIRRFEKLEPPQGIKK